MYSHFYTDEELVKFAKTQNQDLIVCSYGGSGSNWLTKNLEKKYKISTDIWKKKLCHYIRPLNNIPVKYAIYIYSDPLYSCVSQLNRKGKYSPTYFEQNYYKMLDYNSKHIKYNIGVMLENMIKQMNNWKNTKVNYPIILVKYEKMSENIHKLFSVVNSNIYHKFTSRRTNKNTINSYYGKYNLGMYSSIIERARTTYNSMPDYHIIYPNQKNIQNNISSNITIGSNNQTLYALDMWD